MKSNLGFVLRSSLARRASRESEQDHDLILQTHALFSAVGRAHAIPVAVYVDCTYREAMRGWSEWTPLRGPARRLWLRAERKLYRGAAHLFTFTQRSRDSLIQEYGVDPARVTVVGAGVNFHAAPEHLSATSGNKHSSILFVGKDFERKGGHVLLAAFARLRAEFPDVRLQVVGTELPDRVPEGVDVLGRIDDRAVMDELYANADVFCLPSLFDPAPLVVLEAMGHGMPCVLSRDAAAHVDDLVDRGGGQICETGDPVALAEALATYLRDPDRAGRAGDIARAAMAAEYTWDRVVDRMAPALAAVARQARAANRS